MIDLNKEPTRKQLWTFGVGFSPFTLVVVALFLRNLPVAAVSVAASGLLVTLIFVCIAATRKPLYFGWIRLTYPIGWLVTHSILALGYYLLVTPLGCLLKLLRKDLLERTVEPERSSYWISDRARDDLDRYFRQY